MPARRCLRALPPDRRTGSATLPNHIQRHGSSPFTDGGATVRQPNRSRRGIGACAGTADGSTARRLVCADNKVSAVQRGLGWTECNCHALLPVLKDFPRAAGYGEPSGRGDRTDPKRCIPVIMEGHHSLRPAANSHFAKRKVPLHAQDARDSGVGGKGAAPRLSAEMCSIRGFDGRCRIYSVPFIGKKNVYLFSRLSRVHVALALFQRSRTYIKDGARNPFQGKCGASDRPLPGGAGLCGWPSPGGASIAEHPAAC